MLDHDRMIRVYLKMRARRAELKKSYEEEDSKIVAGMQQIEGLLLGSLLDAKVKSMAAESGTFFIERLIHPRCEDWETYRRWMVENDALDGVEKRVTKSFIVDYMDRNKDETPPGITVQREQVVRVRAK